MRCLVQSRNKDFGSQFILRNNLQEYIDNATKYADIKHMSKYTQNYEMSHTRFEACRNASEYTLQVRQPYLDNIKGILYDLETYTISINDRGGRLSCTFRRRIDINVGDIVYMIYTTTKCSKIAGRFEVESISTTNNATTITALDTCAILSTMTVSLAIGGDIPPEMALEYLGEQINIPIYVREGTTLRFSPGGAQPNSYPQDIINNYINTNTTVCLDDLGIVAIKSVDFTDYYITLEACRGDWNLEVQYHNEYLTRARLLDLLDQASSRPYWDFGAELLYGKVHATETETKPLIYKRYTVGKDTPPSAEWIDIHIDSGEYSIADGSASVEEFAHMQASKKRMLYILVARDLPVCYDLCPGDVVFVCYQYGSDSPKNCLMRIREITFADDRMTLKGSLHLTQHPIKYAPVMIQTNVYDGRRKIRPIDIDVMSDIDIHRWQLANPYR
jgi:hypothetical protein